MNREQGDAPLAAGVDGGRMFWTVSGDSPPHGFPFPNLSTGPPSSLSHPLQEFTWLTGPWAPPAPPPQAFGLPPGAGRLALGLVFSYSPLGFHLSITGLGETSLDSLPPPTPLQAPPGPPSMGSWDNKVPSPAFILYCLTL